MKSKTILIKSPNQKFEYHTSLCHSLFNPRSREGSDNHDPEAIKMHKAFQSSLPRRERQVSSDYLLDLNPISIHAPAKGATYAAGRGGLMITQFQSTLPRRERPSVSLQLRSAFQFQSTLPRRERLILVELADFFILISIHAPAKGAT